MKTAIPIHPLAVHLLDGPAADLQALGQLPLAHFPRPLLPDVLPLLLGQDRSSPRETALGPRLGLADDERSLIETLAWPYGVITLRLWLEYLEYVFLTGISQPGFPATLSATRWRHFHPVAGNSPVYSHVGRIGLTLGYVPDSPIMALDPMTLPAKADAAAHPAHGPETIYLNCRCNIGEMPEKCRSNAPSPAVTAG